VSGENGKRGIDGRVWQQRSFHLTGKELFFGTFFLNHPKE
jgi:hypothetical protein